MKSLLNLIAKEMNALNKIRGSLFFQSMSTKEKQDFYDAKESLNKLYHTVLVKQKNNMEKLFEKFKKGTKVMTTVFMSTEDIGGLEDVPFGTIGTVFAEPSDNEELVGVIIEGSFNYLPQDVLEVVSEEEISFSPHVTKVREHFKDYNGKTKMFTKDEKLSPLFGAWSCVRSQKAVRQLESLEVGESTTNSSGRKITRIF